MAAPSTSTTQDSRRCDRALASPSASSAPTGRMQRRRERTSTRERTRARLPCAQVLAAKLRICSELQHRLDALKETMANEEALSARVRQVLATQRLHTRAAETG